MSGLNPRRLTVTGKCMALQSSDGVNSLVMARGPGSQGVTCQVRPFDKSEGRVTSILDVDIVFGIFNLLGGPYLAVVTKSRLVGAGRGKTKFYLVERVDFVPFTQPSDPAVQKNDAWLLDQLRSVIHTRSFFFAQDYDITLSVQAQQDSDASAQPWQRADARFFWNRHLLEPLMVAAAHEFICPIISGMVKVLPSLTVGEHEFDLVFISRRGCQRVGTRFNKRGLDADGNAANFAETEQILLHEQGGVSSYVQIRGSIPLYWTQYVTMRYMPRVKKTGTAEEAQAAFTRHMNQLKHHGVVTCVNLIDKKKDQLMLGEAFERAVNRLNSDQVKFVWFDFHHECRKMRWGNLSKLVDILEATLRDSGFFHMNAQGQVQQRQLGVLRTNCMDNLDRTNVVQSLFARRFIMMATGKLAEQTSVLSSRFKSFEKAFKNVWADHADAISDLYAGTGALKTDFTRTGKRTFAGLLQDGWRSVKRYMINNLQDGHNQDAWDLFTGRFVPSSSKMDVIKSARSGITIEKFLRQLLVVFLCLLVVATTTVAPPDLPLFARVAIGYMVAAALFGLVSWLQLKKGVGMGGQLVNAPVFCPHAKLKRE